MAEHRDCRVVIITAYLPVVFIDYDVVGCTPRVSVNFVAFVLHASVAESGTMPAEL